MTALVEKVSNKLEEVSESYSSMQEEVTSLKDEISLLKKRNDDPDYRDPKAGVFGNPNSGSFSSDNKETSGNHEKREAVSKFIRTGNVDEYQKRQLSTTVGEDGGVTVEPFLSKMMDKIAIDLNPIAQNSTVEDISDSNSFRKLISLGGSQAVRRKELEERGETSTPKLHAVDINLYELSAYPAMTNEIISSSSFNIIDWVQNESGEAFAATENIEYLTGEGDAAGQAKGILTYPQTLQTDADRAVGELQYMEAAANNDIDSNELIKLIYALKPSYRANAKWYMSTEAIQLVRSLKDNTGRYIWADSLAVGQPSVLAGYPVVEVPAMSGMVGNGVPIMFGDMKRAYYVVNNTSHRNIIVDRVTQAGWTKLFIAKMSGGGLVDSNALKLLRLPA